MLGDRKVHSPPTAAVAIGRSGPLLAEPSCSMVRCGAASAAWHPALPVQHVMGLAQPGAMCLRAAPGCLGCHPGAWYVLAAWRQDLAWCNTAPASNARPSGDSLSDLVLPEGAQPWTGLDQAPDMQQKAAPGARWPETHCTTGCSATVALSARRPLLLQGGRGLCARWRGLHPVGGRGHTSPEQHSPPSQSPSTIYP